MSEQSWRKEFYPTPASDFAGSTDLIAATKHSLQKWKGALPENLEKHEIEDKPVDYRGATCSLCNMADDDCGSCPIVVSGNPECCEEGSAYSDFCRPNDSSPSPMIATLQTALTYLESKQ